MGLDNPLHLALLVVILLLLFGAKRLPEIGRSLGSGMREFKQSISGDGPSHDQQQPAAQQPTLPAAPVQTAAQTAAQASSAASAQDAFAQRDPASTEQH
jgi:sec-independent protein translocase protein TatA